VINVWGYYDYSTEYIEVEFANPRMGVVIGFSRSGLFRKHYRLIAQWC
jgi:hypothetical protein